MNTPTPAPQDEPKTPAIRPPRVLGGFLVAGLGVTALAAVAAGIAQWHMKSVLRPLSTDVPAHTADGYQQADMWLDKTNGVLQASLTVTVLLLVAWFFQMRTNALILDPRWEQRHGMGWLLLSCLCAIGLFFVPKMIVNDVWAASSPPPGQRRGNALLTVWWLAVLATAVALSGGFSLLDGGVDVWAITDGMTELIVGSALAVVACALTFVVVRRLLALQAGHPGPAAAVAT